jgi:hypothetical protein
MTTTHCEGDDCDDVADHEIGAVEREDPQLSDWPQSTYDLEDDED